jgi:flagellar basal body-associated protein FliL
MKNDRLEKFVNENRHEFDDMEPSDKVWESINRRLDQQAVKKPNKLIWMRIAAAVIVILAIPAIIYLPGNSDMKQSAKKQAVDPEVQELIEAEAYYAQEVSGKLAEIQKCYKVYPEIKVEVEDDLKELESMYHSLKNDLKENISNKEVIEAMIENNRNRMKLVDDVLEQINC